MPDQIKSPPMVQTLSKKTILIACSGGRCRSFMAAAILNKIYGDKYIFKSAGLFTDLKIVEDDKPEEFSSVAVEILQEDGYVEAKNGYSNQINSSLIDEVDMVVCLTDKIFEKVKSLNKNKNKILKTNNTLPDPFDLEGIDESIVKELMSKAGLEHIRDLKEHKEAYKYVKELIEKDFAVEIFSKVNNFFNPELSPIKINPSEGEYKLLDTREMLELTIKKYITENLVVNDGSEEEKLFKEKILNSGAIGLIVEKLSRFDNQIMTGLIANLNNPNSITILGDYLRLDYLKSPNDESNFSINTIKRKDINNDISLWNSYYRLSEIISLASISGDLMRQENQETKELNIGKVGISSLNKIMFFNPVFRILCGKYDQDNIDKDDFDKKINEEFYEISKIATNQREDFAKEEIEQLKILTSKILTKQEFDDSNKIFSKVLSFLDSSTEKLTNIDLEYFFKLGEIIYQATKFDSTPLVEAILKDDIEILKLLLAAGKDPNQATKTGTTPFSMAIFNGKIEMAQILINAGVNINPTIKGGITPFSMAVLKGNIEILRFLIEVGVNINQEIKDGAVPLSVAVYQGKMEIFNLLLDAGADPNQVQQKIQTSVFMAVAQEKMLMALRLVAVGADPYIKSQGNSSFAIAGVKLKGAELRNFQQQMKLAYDKFLGNKELVAKRVGHLVSSLKLKNIKINFSNEKLSRIFDEFKTESKLEYVDAIWVLNELSGAKNKLNPANIDIKNLQIILTSVTEESFKDNPFPTMRRQDTKSDQGEIDIALNNLMKDCKPKELLEALSCQAYAEDNQKSPLKTALENFEKTLKTTEQKTYFQKCCNDLAKQYFKMEGSNAALSSLNSQQKDQSKNYPNQQQNSNAVASVSSVVDTTHSFALMLKFLTGGKFFKDLPVPEHRSNKALREFLAKDRGMEIPESNLDPEITEQIKPSADIKSNQENSQPLKTPPKEQEKN